MAFESHIKLWSVSMCWRFICIQLGYLLFGSGSLVLALLLMPIINTVSASDKKYERNRFLIQQTFRIFIGFLRLTGVLSYEIKNFHKLKPGCLVMANHPSLLDIVFLFSFIPNANCVVKSKLLLNPFTRFPILSAGYIVNDDPQEVIEQANKSFASGEIVIIFPEGTRTPAGQQPCFKRGASQLAVRTGKDVTPIIIISDPPALTKTTPWFSVTRQPWCFNFYIENPILVNLFLAPDKPLPLQARHLTRYLQDYFSDNIRGERHCK